MNTFPCVYIVTCRDWKNNGDPYYKIGRTINPENRLNQLRKHFNRNNLKYVCLFKTNIDDESRIENILHRKFKKYKLHDESSVELFKMDLNVIIDELIKLQNNDHGEIVHSYQLLHYNI